MSYLEINLQYLTKNYTFLKSKLNPKTKFMAVIKASAYGSGSVSVAQHLESLGVDYFAVAYTKEGIELRKNKILTPILVLHPSENDLEQILKHNLEPTIYAPHILKKVLDLNFKTLSLHIEINTGLNRLGFQPSELDNIINLLLENKITIKSIFSHLVASEDISKQDFILKQCRLFKKLINNVKAKTEVSFMSHLLNTSGILNYSDYQMDIVRSGIGLYGFGNDEKYKKDLLPIMALRSKIYQIHTLSKGENVGYNFGFLAKKTMRIAALPLGHADGISRAYGNAKGYVIINGKRAYIIGNVCMDVIMVDVTNIDCTTGDEVTVFDEKFTAEMLAKRGKTISYELITALSNRLERRIIK